MPISLSTQFFNLLNVGEALQLSNRKDGFGGDVLLRPIHKHSALHFRFIDRPSAFGSDRLFLLRRHLQNNLSKSEGMVRQADTYQRTFKSRGISTFHQRLRPDE
jgi:hypothetical protein